MNEGLIFKQKHPTEELYIYNYTKWCMIRAVWNDTTIKCRGLILDKDYNLIARPFQKFYVYDWDIVKEDLEKRIGMKYRTFNKLDGSIGILYFLNGKPYITSRGSFDSDFARIANDLLYTKYADSISKFNPNYTYIFELILPSIQSIVVKYSKDDELHLLGILDTQNFDKEIFLYSDHSNELGFKQSEEFIFNEENNNSYYSSRQDIFNSVRYENVYKGINTFHDLQKLNWKNCEGFVIVFEDGFRVKIKFNDYMALHSNLFHISTKSIWNILKNKNLNFEEIISGYPDEWYDWCISYASELKDNYKVIDTYYKEKYVSVLKHNPQLAKAFAEAIKNEKNNDKGFLFSIFQNKDYSEEIWNKIQPKFEKPIIFDKEE